MRNVVYAVPDMRFFGELAKDALGYELALGNYVGDCDDCHIIGMYDPNGYEATLKNTARAKRRIIHWCGTDVLMLQDASVLPEAVHVADAPWLVEELHGKGVYATTVMWPTRHHFEVMPLPDKPMFACYLGSSNGAAYGSETLQMLAEALPEYGFIGYRYGEYDAEGMAGLVKASTCALRLTHHDGSGASPREFMEAGRYAITSMPLPFATRVRPDDLVGLIKACRQVAARKQPDAEAAGYWAAQNSEARFLAEMGEVAGWLT